MLRAPNIQYMCSCINDFKKRSPAHAQNIMAIMVPKPLARQIDNGMRTCLLLCSLFSSHQRKLTRKVAAVGKSAGIYGVDHPSGADSASESAKMREVAPIELRSDPIQSNSLSCDSILDLVRRTSGGRE